jgi:hypothetical protein
MSIDEGNGARGGASRLRVTVKGFHGFSPHRASYVGAPLLEWRYFGMIGLVGAIWKPFYLGLDGRASRDQNMQFVFVCFAHYKHIAKSIV